MFEQTIRRVEDISALTNHELDQRAIKLRNWGEVPLPPTFNRHSPVTKSGLAIIFMNTVLEHGYKLFMEQTDEYTEVWLTDKETGEVVTDRVKDESFAKALTILFVYAKEQINQTGKVQVV